MEILTRSEACGRGNVSEISILSQKTDQSSYLFRNLSDLLNAQTGKGAECQGFSIREYVRNVRSVNIRKCWPFSEGLLEDELIRRGENLLPPLNRPCNKSCHCQNCSEEQREKREHETSFLSSQHPNDPPGNCLSTADGTIDTQKTVCSEGSLNIPNDLEEQIQKLTTVHILEQNESGSEDEDNKRRRDTRDAGLVEDRSLRRSIFRAEPSNIETLDCTLHFPGKEKPTGGQQGEQPETSNTAIQNHDGKPVTVMPKDSLKEGTRLSFRSCDLTESECQLIMDVRIRQETETAKEVARDQALGGSVSMQSERSNIANLNSQPLEIQFVTQSLSNISNDEGSAVKICPVCRTFSSDKIPAVNNHIDNYLAQTSKAEKKKGEVQTQKLRKQKMRSLADICAATAPNNNRLDDLQNMATRESEVSVTPDCELTISTIETGLARAISDDLTRSKLKKKRACLGNFLVQHGKFENEGGGAAGSLNTETKRPRLEIIAGVSEGLEDLNMALAASHCTKTDPGVEHHLKHSSIQGSRDLNFEQSQSTEVNQVQNGFPDSNNEQSNMLGDSKCRHHKIYNTSSTTLHVEGTSKNGDPNFRELSDKISVNKKLTLSNPAKAGEAQKSNDTYFTPSLKEDSTVIETELSDQHAELVTSEFKLVAKTDGMNIQVENTKTNLGDACSTLSNQCIDREKKGSMDNVIVIEDTTKITEDGHLQQIQLDLNEKSCVIPRDSTGHFLSSRIVGGEKDDSLYSLWNHEPRHKTTKSPTSFLNSSAKKEYIDVEAYPSTNDNAMDHLNLSLHRNCSDDGYIGLQKDFEGELFKPKTPNNTVSNESSVSQGKKHSDFNFVKRSKSRHDTTLFNHSLQTWSSKYLPQEDNFIQFKQPDYQQEYLKSKSTKENADKGLSEWSSFADKNETEKMLYGRPRFGSNSSTSLRNGFSVLAMQSNVHPEHNGDQSRKAALLEKIHPLAEISKKKHCTDQPVIRLMGKTFTIGGEEKAENSFKHPQQCTTTNTISRNPMGTPRNQFDPQCSAGNALYPNCRTKANTSKSIQHNLKESHSLNRIQCAASHQDRTLDNNVPKLLERRFSRKYVQGHSLKKQSDSAQAWISSPIFSAPKANMPFSPVKRLCNNPDLNKGQKMKYQDCHVSKWHCTREKHAYRQLLDSSLEKCTFQKKESNGCLYTSSSSLPQSYYDKCKSSSCPIDNFDNFSVPPHSFTSAVARSTYISFQQSHCPIPSSYASISDSPTMVMPEKFISSSVTSHKCDKQSLKFPMTPTRKTNDIIHQKMGETTAAKVDRKSQGYSQTREFVKETKGLLGKHFSERHEDYWTVLMEKSDTFSRTEDMQKRMRAIHQETIPSDIASEHIKIPENTKSYMMGIRHGEISRTNKSKIEPSNYGGNSSRKERESELNVSCHAGFSQKWLQNDSELFMKPDKKCTEPKPSTTQLHYSNAGWPLKFTEPKKSIGGVKHTPKPFSENGNGEQFLPMHFTLPFVETRKGDTAQN